jgi:4-amino-4-deoxy-L-arabinose transferase-like glycosyltransferase
MAPILGEYPHPGFIERWQKLLARLLLTALILISLLSARRHTLTYDEPAHYEYGLQLLGGEAARFDDSKMPFSALNALPGRLAARLAEGDYRYRLEQVATGRVATILFSALAALAVFGWSRSLYGALPALFSLFLYVFDPNLIAHGQLVTTDLYAAGMVLFSAYALWLWTRRRDLKHALLFGVVVGLAQLAKYTCVFLYPLLAAVLLVCDAPELVRYFTRRDRAALRTYFRQLLVLTLVVILAGLLVINAGFLFDRTFTPLGEYDFQSDLFRAAQARLAPLARLPVPLPYPFLQGLDLVRYVEQTGANFSRIYLLGELREGPFPSYYFIAALFKTPLATQAFLLLALGLCIYRLVRLGSPVSVSTIVTNAGYTRAGFLHNEWFLLGPALFFTLYFNFFYRAQIGIRHYLVVFPLLYVFSGGLLSGWGALGRLRRAGIGLLCAGLVLSVLSYFPHYLPYFNELAPDRRYAYKILADSNLDWGQSAWYVQRFLENHPDAHVDPGRPVAGTVLVSPNNLVGITAKPHRFAWLRENFEPAGTIAYSYLIYEIPRESLDDLRR